MGDFIKKTTGEYYLSGVQGKYVCDITPGGAVLKANDGREVGTFTCDPIPGDFPLDLERAPDRPMPVVGVCESEIIAEIQKPGSDGAYFVLPSQLNGAEYPAPDYVVGRMDDYLYDNTGGPRGQLAVHPAAGQFILDNAAHDGNPEGINAIDALLADNDTFMLQNGYLKMPLPDNQQESKAIWEKFLTSIHTLRPLLMSGVPASGLVPSKGTFSSATHKVNLVYASAVPLETYNNRPGTPVQKALHNKVAEAILVAQYYGALKAAASKAKPGTKAKVFLMPLGGGVFNNSFGSIGKSISMAVEMLDDGDREKLTMEVLTWNGNRNEAIETCQLLNMYKKYKAPDVQAP
jgi:hypothetical protein